MKLTIKPSLKQHEAYQILEDKETKELLFGGGGGGGKSWLGCEWLVTMALRYPETRYFIARKTLKNLKKTTLRTFFKVCSHHSVKQGVHYNYNEQSATITFPNGSTVDLLEVKYNPSDPMFEDLGSSEYTSGWIEEAGEVDFGAYDTLKSRIGRQKNDEHGITDKLLITCNPKKNWLYKFFYKPFKDGTLPEYQKFLQSLVGDNTQIEKNYRENLVNIKDPVKKQRLLYGNWEYDDDPSVLIEFEAIDDMWTNTVDESEERYLIGDIARFGQDKTVIYLFRGFDLYKKFVWTKQDTMVTRNKIKDILKDERIPYSHVAIDDDGVGGGVVDGLSGIHGFVNNSRALPNKVTEDKENYRNLKSQCYFLLAQYVNSHKLRVSVNDPEWQEQLREELEQVRDRHPDSDDKAKEVVPKDKVKETLGRSPDYSDTLMMRMYFELLVHEVEEDDLDDEGVEVLMQEPEPLFTDIGI